MKYVKPQLLDVIYSNLIEAACLNGDSAGSGLSCADGPEAGEGGCGAGAAASTKCLNGTLAGSKCDFGTGF